MAELRALTLRQPWGWAIAHGGKDVENRSWQPPCTLDLLAIHAGAYSRWDRSGEESPLVQQAWRQWITTLPADNVALPRLRRNSLHLDFGAVVAVAEVRTCHFDGNCWRFPKFDEGSGRCSPWAAGGQWHWQLSAIRPLAKPVPCRGALGLWKLPDDVAALVRAQLEVSIYV